MVFSFQALPPENGRKPNPTFSEGIEIEYWAKLGY